jgi:ABC-type multidrug transport system fused ATPase/permease subunit
MRLFKNLLWYYRSQWRRYAFAMVILGIVAGLNLVAPWITGRVIDAAANGTLTISMLARYAAALIGIAVSIYVLRYLWRVALYSASYQLGAILRRRIHDHLLLQPPAFFQRYNTGDLMARATNDVTAVEMSAGEAVLAFFDGIFTGAVIACVLFFAIDWRLTLLAMLPWPLMAVALWRVNNELHTAFNDAQARFSDMNDRVQEHIGAIRLIKSYGLESRAFSEFDGAVDAARISNIKVARAEAKYDPIIHLAVGAAFLIAIAGGAVLIDRGEMTVGELTSFNLYLGNLVWPMFAYGWLLNMIERGNAAYARIDEILRVKPDVNDAGISTLKQVLSLQWDIREFRYPRSARPALANWRGAVASGDMLGIVGPTGSGKSSFVRLLLRQYEDNNASLLINGQPLSQFSLAALRAQIVVVPQEPFLFSQSVAENIALGNPAATQDDIEKAARIACLHDDIVRFPDGYNTLVGERGVTLSGGQKQRMAIARALLMDANVLVLDDALSAVDVQTERSILDALRRSRTATSDAHAKITIVICHRLTAVEHASHIVVLDHGVPIEQGTHQSLLAQGGWYARIHDYQQIEQAVLEGR